MKDIEQMKARLEAATDEKSWSISIGDRENVVDADGDWVAECDSPDTAEFVAHAPEDMRRLIARVERLEEIAESARTTMAAVSFFLNTGDIPYAVKVMQERSGQIAKEIETALAEEDGE